MSIGPNAARAAANSGADFFLVGHIEIGNGVSAIAEFGLQRKERITTPAGKGDARPSSGASTRDGRAYARTGAGDKHMPIVERILRHGHAGRSTGPRTSSGTGKIGFILQLGRKILLRPSNRFQADFSRFVQSPSGIGEMRSRDGAKVGAACRDD